MSGAAQSAGGCAAAGMGHELVSVTIGNSGSSFGFSNGGYGSMSQGAVRGLSIGALISTSGSDLFLGITGASSQSLFNHITVQDTAGTTRTYRQQDATYGSGTWSWGSGSSKVWTATTPSPRVVRFFY